MSHPTGLAARLRPWLACALLSAFAGAAAGDLYQWKDAKGVTHYADSPPPNQAYTSRTIRQRGTAEATAASAPTQSAQCVTARLNLQHLQGTAAVGFDADGDGKPDTPFSAQERSVQIERAQADIKAHCAARPERPD